MQHFGYQTSQINNLNRNKMHLQIPWIFQSPLSSLQFLSGERAELFVHRSRGKVRPSSSFPSTQSKGSSEILLSKISMY